MYNFFKGLNFTALNPSVDIYVFSLLNFKNECTEETRNGITPIDGNKEHTLVRQIYTKSLFNRKKCTSQCFVGKTTTFHTKFTNSKE